MSAIYHQLSPGVRVIERGWLNCNQVLMTGEAQNVLIDSGYGRHAEATLGILDACLGGASLQRLINTHCHSDHMGGNRAVRARYQCRVTIPVGEVRHVVPWTEQSCWSAQMDQYAEEFTFDDTIAGGDRFQGGGLEWQAHAAPGHDMDALMFHAPQAGILITGDALWQRGLGFVWPQQPGTTRSEFIAAAFAALDTIEALKPAVLVPGHGAPFTDLARSLADARGKLSAFERDPVKNARHAARSLFVFALLDKGSMPLDRVEPYLDSVPVYREFCRDFLGGSTSEFAAGMLQALTASGALVVEGGVLRPTMRA